MIVVAGAGTGLSAKCAEAGGADAVVIYNSGRYRMAGRGSLAGLMPYGDANRIVLEMTREVVTVVDRMPVIAGVCGTDPFRDMARLLDELAGRGVAGVQNFPTVGLIDGGFRRALEATGMSYSAEVEMIRLACRRGLFTMPYVFTAAEATAMVDAGADVLVRSRRTDHGRHDRRLRPPHYRVIGAGYWRRSAKPRMRPDGSFPSSATAVPSPSRPTSKRSFASFRDSTGSWAHPASSGCLPRPPSSTAWPASAP